MLAQRYTDYTLHYLRDLLFAGDDQFLEGLDFVVFHGLTNVGEARQLLKLQIQSDKYHLVDYAHVHYPQAEICISDRTNIIFGEEKSLPGRILFNNITSTEKE